MRFLFKGGFYFNLPLFRKTAVTIQGRLLFEGGFYLRLYGMLPRIYHTNFYEFSRKLWCCKLDFFNTTKFTVFSHFGNQNECHELKFTSQSQAYYYANKFCVKLKEL